MSASLESAVSMLPHELIRAAPALASRVVQGTQEALSRDSSQPGTAYCALLMKVGAVDIQREFSHALKDSIIELRGPSPDCGLEAAAGLWLEPVGHDDPTAATMQRSSELFARVAAVCRQRGIRGFEPFAKGLFLGPLRQALAKARVDEESAARIMPYACSLLDIELVKLYEGLGGLDPAGC